MVAKKITKAILPVAGFGTRFLPATKAQPKEMLPIFDTPAIQLIVEEAVEAGITDIIIVTGRGKRAIEDHFDDNFELEAALDWKGKEKELEMISRISDLANFAYVRQPKPLGDGHALLCARSFVDEEPVVVLFGDDIVRSSNGKNAVQQLIEVYEETEKPVIMLEEVAREMIDQYGIVGFDKLGEKHGKILNFVEKPDPDFAPSNLGVVGKYIITPEIFKLLEETREGSDGEIRLANAFIDYLKQGNDLYGRVLEGERFDTGSKIGFLKATIDAALNRDDIKGELLNYLRGRVE